MFELCSFLISAAKDSEKMIFSFFSFFSFIFFLFLFYFLIKIVREVFRSHENMLPERYPFQRMNQLISSMDRLNDLFLELVREINKRSFAIKMFVRDHLLSLSISSFNCMIIREWIGGFIQMMWRISHISSKMLIPMV